MVSYEAARHGEYDFGSYKRAFRQADLSGYDVVYLVNDSVVGPLRPLEPYLLRMEALGTDAFGLVLNPSRHGRHLQSWFIGLKPSVFRAPWFAEFLSGVEALGRKEDVCIRYENGLARLLEAHSASYAGLWELRGKAIYNAVGRLSRQGFPFLKKSAFTRHGGSLGPAVARALSQAKPSMALAIVADLDRLYGEEYRRVFLSEAPCAPSAAISAIFPASLRVDDQQSQGVPVHGRPGLEVDHHGPAFPRVDGESVAVPVDVEGI